MNSQPSRSNDERNGSELFNPIGEPKIEYNSLATQIY